ncbi:MAG TPA: alpha/beta fold hydrolase [Anaerolineales bacterium]|nr:alpha/beta fold hydrolase [Anaerolineales bacterium]
MPSTGRTPESLHVSLPDLNLRVLHWPGREGKAPFLLLHGLASNARFWELVAPTLSEAGHPLWAPDLRGHGQSDKPDGGYDFATIASDVRQLIRRLEIDRPILAGHSWGGMVALEAMGRAHPDRLQARGLALIDGGIGQVNDYPGATREAAVLALTPPRLEGVPLETLMARLEASPRGFPIDTVRREIILANFELRPDGTVAPHLKFDHHMTLVHAMWESPVYELFERIHCPVLMVPARGGDVRGVRDQVYRDLKERGVARARRVIPELRVVWMDDTDHDIPLHKPEALAQLLLELAHEVQP